MTLASALLVAGLLFAAALYFALGQPYTKMYLAAAFMIAVGALWLWADISERV